MESRRFAEHLRNVTGIPMAFYTSDRDLRWCRSEDRNHYGKWIPESKDFSELIGETDRENLLIRDVADNVWLTLIRTGKSEVCVIGPAAFSNNAPKAKGMPQIEYRQYVEIILMVYEFLTGKELSAEEFLEKHFSNVRQRSKWLNSWVENALRAQEQKRPHHSRGRERRLLDTIRQGNAAEFKQVYDEPLDGYMGVLAKNEVRSGRNLGITMITVFARAAMDGGVGYEQAMTMSDAMINQIETLNKWEDIYMYCRESGAQYAELAAKRQSGSVRQVHLLADRCESLIFARIHERITVKTLAQELSVNPNYLSRLFHESTGITISDYIQREKITLARHMLVYSQYELEDIGAYLGFSTQSHFGKIFKKQTGLTPGQYRKQYASFQFFEKEPDT